mmetsp:Transcript_18748/g.28789  ORF Transcript_18748/g.28789 Transcript_18748/m.28789 type:complete len:292 (-) Transcript_18748:1792-2667(-)
MSDNKKPADKKADGKKAELPQDQHDELQDKLELCVERLSDKDATLRKNALEMIKTEVAGATSSMTSVPKPLKFMTPLYPKLKEIYDEYKSEDDFKKQLADLNSVIGMVAAPKDSFEMLDFCLKGTLTDLKSWGHEYLRSLSGQISKAYEKRIEDSKPTDDLLGMVDIIVPQFINHNEEPEAVDLLMETESLSKLITFCDSRNYDRVCRYLCSCSQYAADTEEMVQSYTTAYLIYKSQKQYPDALRVAQRMNNMAQVSEIMEECKDPVVLKQMAFMLGRQRNPFESEDADLN